MSLEEDFDLLVETAETEKFVITKGPLVASPRRRNHSNASSIKSFEGVELDLDLRNRALQDFEKSELSATVECVENVLFGEECPVINSSAYIASSLSLEIETERGRDKGGDTTLELVEDVRGAAKIEVITLVDDGKTPTKMAACSIEMEDWESPTPSLDELNSSSASESTDSSSESESTDSSSEERSSFSDSSENDVQVVMDISNGSMEKMQEGDAELFIISPPPRPPQRHH